MSRVVRFEAQPAGESAPLRQVADFLAQGLVAPEEAGALEEVAARYALALTPAMAALIAPGAAEDPIARQFVPRAEELITAPEERADPIGDHVHEAVEGLIHRYPDRVLLKLVNVCAVYCRFCFRREMVGPGQGAMLSPAKLAAALDYIRARPAIWEVILSGGDPLMTAPRRLAEVVAAIGAIPHVRVLRVHTRIPVVEPARITEDLVAALRHKNLATYVALHANHAREFSSEARAACARIVDAGIPMISQSVLLRGVNDSVEALGELMRTFVACRIKPYYLHHLDLAPGTAHFRVPVAEGVALMKALRGTLSGLCQPHYMLDIPGGHGKAVLGEAQAAETFSITDFRGHSHAYPPQD